MKDHDDTPPPEKVERQGVVTDLAVAAVAGGATGAANAVATKLLNPPAEPPPTEPEPEVILPPGVEKPQ